MRNGGTVQRFEQAFAEYVGAKYCIALCNGTATLHTALAALGVKPGDRVAVPPLTMASTTIAVLHAGAVPVFVDVDPDTWLIDPISVVDKMPNFETPFGVPVSLYGLHGKWNSAHIVDDAAQTLRPHGDAAFTSYSFQASKILALGEGGMLATNDEELARKAREFSSLGYDMSADTSKIDPATLKHPTYARHHSLGWNYRLSHIVAHRAWQQYSGYNHPHGLGYWDYLKSLRLKAAYYYREAIEGCNWITPQHVPDGWTHDYWCYAVALESAELWEPFTESIVRHGGEMPYGAWRLTYQEPAFKYLRETVMHGFDCPIAEDLQPRLVQAQTNDVASAQRNADAWAKAIREIDG